MAVCAAREVKALAERRVQCVDRIIEMHSGA